MQLRRSWSAWTQRGLWCAGRVLACQTWTVTKSLGGSLAAAWRESWSSPAYRRSERSPHANTLPCGVEVVERQRKVEDQRWESKRHCALQWQGHKTVDGPSWERERAAASDWEQSQMGRNAKRKGSVAQRQKLYPTGGKTLIKDQKLFRWLIYFL